MAGYCMAIFGFCWLIGTGVACRQSMTRFERLRALPCCQCGATPVDVAHANWQEFGKGMGKKADDAYTIPLCRSCHNALDWYAGKSREQAKIWFLGKLELVNKAIDEQQSCF